MGPSFAFQTTAGSLAVGREARCLIALCDAYVDALINRTLHSKQEPIARAAWALQRAIGAVGIEALVDEATGYQRVRVDDYLQRRVDAFLRHEADGWERRFSPELVAAICRLYGHTYDGGRFPTFLRGIFGKVYDLVLGPDVAKELRARNPVPRMGSNHHQFLKAPLQRTVVEDLRVVAILAEQSGTPAELWARLAAHFRKEPFQMAFVA